MAGASASAVRSPSERRRYPATHTGSVSESSRLPPFRTWFPALVRDELRPYPGRGILMLRYTAAATLVMLAIVIFRLPGAAVGGFFCIVLPRDSPQSTLRSGAVLLLTIACSLAFVLGGTILFVNYPLTHFLWVTASFFLGFYAMSTVSNYAVASAFAIVIVVAVPQWDAQLPTFALLVANLWTAGSIALAVVVTIVVEAVFALFRQKDPLQAALSERLQALSRLFSAPTAAHLEKVQQLATVGVSRMRDLALNASGAQAEDAAHRSTTVALVGRIIDLAASLQSMPHTGDPQIVRLGRQMQALDALLGQSRATLPPPYSADAQEGSLVLQELERNADTLRLVLTHQNSFKLEVDSTAPKKPGFFKDDAWTNPEHLRYGVRGALAALFCYIVMRGVFWPGLSTALFTCVVTALGSSGASRQKQLLRVTGATTGSVLIGLVGQIVVLPMLDTISGFLVYFVVVLIFASWFITASPRVNYFGVQVALGFFLVNLNTPYPEYSLTASRNNIAGILLGLVAMWLIFDHLWSRPAPQVMVETFTRNLRMMAKLSGPWERDSRSDLAAIRGLREGIDANFKSINQLSDAILFEFGRDRRRALRVRAVLRGAQPTLRALFLLDVAALQLRVGPAARPLMQAPSQQRVQFDDELRNTLQQIADMVASRGAGRRFSPAALHALKAAAQLSNSDCRDPGDDPETMLTCHQLQIVTSLNQMLSEMPVLQP